MNISRLPIGKPLLRSIIALAVVAAAVSAKAEIYQWKDENGQTVFSATPPPGAEHQVVKPKYGKESSEAIEKLKTRTAPKPPADPATAKKEDKKPKEPTAKEKAANCAKAREVRQQLEESRRLRVKNEKGELSYISEEDRQKRVGDADKSIGAWCK